MILKTTILFMLISNSTITAVPILDIKGYDSDKICSHILNDFKYTRPTEKFKCVTYTDL